MMKLLEWARFSMSCSAENDTLLKYMELPRHKRTHVIAALILLR